MMKNLEEARGRMEKFEFALLFNRILSCLASSVNNQVKDFAMFSAGKTL